MWRRIMWTEFFKNDYVYIARREKVYQEVLQRDMEDSDYYTESDTESETIESGTESETTDTRNDDKDR